MFKSEHFGYYILPLKVMEGITTCLVDDDEDDRFLIREAVEGVIEKVKIKEFSDGTDFLSQIEKLVRRQKSLLILMDVNMPRMNGIEVVKLLKSDLFYRHIPVFFVSTSSEQQQITEALATGASGYFVTRFNEWFTTACLGHQE